MKRNATEALDQLREKVHAANAAARGNPLLGLEIDELRERATGHPIGVNAGGWVNPYPSDDPRNLLLEYQFRNFCDGSRFKVSLQGRQTGKDFTSEGEVVEDCYKRPGTDWMVGAPSERQALDSLSQAKLWAEAWDLYIHDYQEERESGSGSLLKSAEVHIGADKKGVPPSRIRAVPGKPDTVRGRSANVLLTEFDFFERPGETWRAILPSITNPLRGGEKRVRLVSTPNGKGSAMHRIWTKTDTEKMRWSRHLVTIYHAVLMGLPVDWEAVKEALDDPEGWSQEFECEFLDGSNVLLPYEIIALAESAEATEVIDSSWLLARASNPVAVGIDFGRTNDPTICWTLEMVGGVWWTREVLVLRGMSTPDQEAILAPRVARSSRTALDYTGPGIGLGDYLEKRFQQYKPTEHKFGKLELCTFTVGFKREIFPRLRRAFEAPTRVRIPSSVTIREDLHEMRQIIKNGEYTYAAPRTAEGHSDRCTALALALHAAESAYGPQFPPKPFRRNSARQRARRERSVFN